MQEGERVAGVGEGRRRTVAKDIRRAPQQGRYAEQILGNVRHKEKIESRLRNQKRQSPIRVAVFLFIIIVNVIRRGNAYLFFKLGRKVFVICVA